VQRETRLGDGDMTADRGGVIWIESIIQRRAEAGEGAESAPSLPESNRPEPLSPRRPLKAMDRD